jgi:hypothetical protein
MIGTIHTIRCRAEGSNLVLDFWQRSTFTYAPGASVNGTTFVTKTDFTNTTNDVYTVKIQYEDGQDPGNTGQLLAAYTAINEALDDEVIGLVLDYSGGGAANFEDLTDAATADLPTINQPLADALAALEGGGGGGGGSATYAGLTDAATVNLPATNTPLASALTALQTQIDNTALIYDPVILSGTAHTLNAASHANRLLICTNAAGCVLTLQTDAAGGFDKDDSINALQYGAGTVTLAAGATTLRSPASSLSFTPGIYGMVAAVRIGSSEWALTEKASSSGSSGISMGEGISCFTIIQRAGQVALDDRGHGVIVATGTAASRALASTNRLTQTKRIQVSIAAAQHAEVTLRSYDSDVYFDGAYQLFETVFCVSDAIASGTKMFAGLDSGSGAFVSATTEPGFGALTAIGVWAKSTDTQLLFGTRDGFNTTTAVINGGVGFPANTNSTDLYKLRIEYLPASSGSRRAILTLTNLSTGISDTTTFTTNLPPVTQGLMRRIHRSSYLNNAVCSVDFNSVAMGRFV